MTKQRLLELASMGVIRLGQSFPNEDPPGWYVGKILTTPVPKKKTEIWVNYSKEDYNDEDDVKTITTHFTLDTYYKDWVLIVAKVRIAKDSQEKDSQVKMNLA